ncbi:zinc finger protein ZPR1-like protein [Dinothrombium tinctorium]|uniref:Zinc finger protein ZPR1-like protein n=1 Tax=Dinothrombium tinctorium TaxID=1965070 RepID=A0A3S3PLV5_9ACAR|nr:zinc finger protein ZPR1-like protein [Dinothrombium tinctorium]RWS12363.1 zinc finger protein ZPR1-like protein [Dinothrombium tinctorium]RWS14879.1 zinc finger protein ZPR1-like protein [Dinothrombium tinctorium]
MESEQKSNANELFVDLRKEVENENVDESNVTNIESLCLRCNQNGITKVLLTKIPFFKEVAVMSFHCDHCDWSNNELQPVSTIQPKGVIYVVNCSNEMDLNRKVVKTEWAEISIPEVEFEVKKQSGLVTTVEGVIDRAIEGLSQTMCNIPDEQSETKAKFSEFIAKMLRLKNFERKFTFILDDPTGNSFIENPLAPEADPSMQVRYYSRNLEQNKLIGCVGEGDAENDLDNELNLSNEVLVFPTNCSNCNAPCFTNMKLTSAFFSILFLTLTENYSSKAIPYFKDVIIMATNCEACGKKTNEIKSGAGIEEKGVRITKKIQNEDDLKLDVVRSDTCTILIPEIELEVSFSSNGRYTTVEGVIENIKEQLRESNPFVSGDSAAIDMQQKLEKVLQKMNNLIGLTLILDDPTGNSFIQNADENVKYERTYQQNEELGLNDMKVENYES